MGKTMSFSLKKEEIEKIAKFSSINPKMFLYPDRIQVINGTMNAGKNVNKTRSAVYMLDTPYKFEGKIGFLDINNLISVTRLFSDHIIEVNEKFVIVKNLEGTTKIKLWLVPDDMEIIPVGDVESGYQKAIGIDNSTVFVMSWDQLKKITEIKTTLGRDFVFISKNKDNILFKIDNEYEESSTDSGSFEIKDNIEKQNLTTLNNGEHIKWSFDLTPLVEDNYRITLLEKAIIMFGLNTKVKYIFAAEKQ